MILLKSAEIYSPNNIGRKNIFIGGSKILKIHDEIENINDIEVYDCGDKIVVPGLIDQHVHITGGGGEGGFHTRVPESHLSDFIKAGITTVVGLLGTDSTTRSVENLVAKAKSLTREGITAYALTGAYEYPSPAITSSIKKDIVFVNEIIGAKIAANDHRDSGITANELARIGADARVAGMLSEKSGHVTVHMGSGKFDMDTINKALEISNIPISIFRPTHANRKKSLCMDALEYAKKGGYVDFTCSIPAEIQDEEILKMAKEKLIPFDRLSFSSDGFGSWSNYDENGNLIEIGVTPIDSLISTIKKLVNSGFSLEEVLPLFTSNVANSLKIGHIKGHVKENYDADLLILDRDLNLNGVISKGEWLMKDEKILKYGTYEKRQ